jgi:hypothetical protein
MDVGADVVDVGGALRTRMRCGWRASSIIFRVAALSGRCRLTTTTSLT